MVVFLFLNCKTYFIISQLNCVFEKFKYNVLLLLTVILKD